MENACKNLNAEGAECAEKRGEKLCIFRVHPRIPCIPRLAPLPDCLPAPILGDAAAQIPNLSIW
jgi:hypothetical protein